MALCLMKRLQMAGNRPIALIGGGTGYIGDPSGRTDMRNMMTPETIQHNCDCFKKQMERFIEFGEGKAQMVNNADWLLKLNYIELLRDVGACFSVNNMLRAKCYEQRMEKGLSFLEFNYMIMQSYDFYYLFQHYGCNMQFGGDDQWSNMLGGTELIRRKLGKDAHAMTITLLLNSEGKKMGKTASGAVWLDPEKTSPFDFYQYWRNVDDADVLKCIRMLTFLPLEQIDEKVQVLTDGMNGLVSMASSPVFYALGAHPNIEIRFYNTPNPLMPWTFNGRLHDKYILSDDRLLLAGGRNTFDKFFRGLCPRPGKRVMTWIFCSIILPQGRLTAVSVLHQVEQYFQMVWSDSHSKTWLESAPFSIERAYFWRQKPSICGTAHGGGSSGLFEQREYRLHRGHGPIKSCDFYP